ncbi:hypothetical protein Tco_0242109 [Tanacetum coccineum]
MQLLIRQHRYATQSKAYRVFNKRTRIIDESIHVNFDELPLMASDHVSSDPVPQCSTTVLEQESLSLDPQSQDNVPQTAETVRTSNELELLYRPMFNELLNGSTSVVSKSSVIHAADALDNRKHQNITHTSTKTVVAAEPPLNIHITPQTTNQAPTQVPTVTAPENIIQAETNIEYAQVDDDEFINIFRQHGQILNETSNKAKIKKEIDVLETMNIELEHSVAKLLTENEHLNKENETLKKHYKDFSDSGKGFCNCCFKNDLRKLKGNSVDTKFAKTSVLGKPVLQSLRNQSVVRQPNAFKSERPQMSKQQFASQVDVNNNLSRPVTQHYLPKRRESVFAKPDHMIASSESRNSSKNMPRFSSNDMVHNHYLDEARKKTQERDKNSKTSVMPFARFQSTADDTKPKPRSTNHSTRSLPVSKSSCVTITAMPKADQSKSSSSFSDSKHFVCSTCHTCVFNANHDACIAKLLKEANSRAKIQSHKTRNRNKPVDQKSHIQKPGRQIFTGYRFSPNKTSAVYEKISPRSDLSEPPHGSNVDIPNIHECKQTLDVSAGTSINVQKEQSLDLSSVKMEILLEPTSNKLLVGLDDGVAASFQRSRIHKPHAHTQAFKVNRSTSR